MTCGVALQSESQSGGVLILPCGRQRNGSLFRNRGYKVLVSLPYWMDATAAPPVVAHWLPVPAGLTRATSI
jgi:hypothetical protein